MVSLNGNPQSFYYTHNTVVSDSKQILTSGASRTLPTYAKNSLFRDSIFVPGTGAGTYGWYESVAHSPQEGTNTELYNHDITSFTADHDVIPGRTSSLYTAYCANAAFPCVNPTLYFPTSASIGFSCSGCSSSVPLTLSDYHGYALGAGSTFKAGGATPASDTTDMGAAIPAIDAAQVQNLYACPYACGSGPFPDTAGSPTIRLSWTASVTTGVTYSVYRSLSPGACPGSPIATGLTGTFYADVVPPGATFYYNVAAVNGSGTTCDTEIQVTVP